MAPIEHHDKLTWVPLLMTGAYSMSILSLIGLIARSCYRSFLALPPAADTRHRQTSRVRYVKIFGGLALASLVMATFFGSSSMALSYKIWASERGVVLPDSLFGDKGAFRGGLHPGRLEVTRWLKETPLFKDSLEIVTEKARRYWWGQQIDLAGIAWSTFLALEGQRRNIPHLWAYIALSQMVSLSFAQNLFCVAMLMTPVPLPGNVKALTNGEMPGASASFSRMMQHLKRTKPANWCAYPVFYMLPILNAMFFIFLTPFAANTPSFRTVAFAGKLMMFMPCLLPYLVPEKFGTVHTHPHKAHGVYMRIFKTISIISGLLHGKATLLALLYNTPETYYDRHTLFHPFREGRRSAFERGSTAVSRVLGAIGDHPAVSAVGWDVILSGLSLGVWAALRGLDGQEILASCGLWSSKKVQAVTDAMSATLTKTESHAERLTDSLPLPADSALTSTRRRTGRSRKSDTADEGTVAQAVVKTGSKSRKSVSFADEAYEPIEDTPVEGDVQAEEDWESGALTWGLIALAGLGSGSAGVLGCEATAR